MQKDETLFVFFGGTSSSFGGRTTQVELFGEWCKGANKMLFDGCGVTNGFAGVVWARGLDDQVAEVVARVRNDSARRVVAVGLSRGGCACLLLARALWNAFGDDVRVVLLLFDPVPGNSVVLNKLDVFGISLAQRCSDVSMCASLDEVVALYPHEALPDHALHAPVLPRYPPSCAVQEDVLLGCHQGAMWSYVPFDTATRLSFVMIREFLERHGAVLLDEECPSKKAVATNEEDVLNKLDTLAEEVSHGSSERCTHSHTIVRNKSGDFVNKWHAKKRGANEGAKLLLEIKKRT